MNETDSNTVLETLVDLATQDERKGLPSASNWRRYELCPGSHQLAQEARRLGQEAHSEPSAASARGDRIHAALADQEVELTESETTSTEFLRERALDQVRRIFGDAPVIIEKEKRLWFKLAGIEAASGRFDQLTHSGKLALVQDFKSGWKEPDPAELNAQLKFLAVLVAMFLPHVTEVIVQIISGPYGVTEVRFDLAQLAHAYNDIVTTLRKLRDPQAAFNPSPEACRFCPAVNICQAVKNLVLPVARLQHSALPDGERAAKLLDEVALLQEHLDEIREYYSRRLTEDPAYQIPGWALVQGSPRRAFSDWVAARAKLEEFIDAKAFDALVPLSIVKVEKLLGEAIGVKGEKLKEQFKFVLGDTLKENYPAPSLKRIKGQPALTAL